MKIVTQNRATRLLHPTFLFNFQNFPPYNAYSLLGRNQILQSMKSHQNRKFTFKPTFTAMCIQEPLGGLWNVSRTSANKAKKREKMAIYHHTPLVHIGEQTQSRCLRQPHIKMSPRITMKPSKINPIIK